MESLTQNPPTLMDDSTSWAKQATALAIFVLVLTHLLHLHRRRRCCLRLNLPPGPKPWPIIGNLNLIIGSLEHRAIHDLSLEYGPIMQLQLGLIPAVVASSVDMARAFLKTYDHAFASRPPSASGKYTAYNFSDMTWSPYGPYWRQSRKIFHLELFQPKRLESNEFISVRVEEMKSFLRRIYESQGNPITLRNHLSDLSLNIISRMVLGKKYTMVSSKGSFNDIVKTKELKEMIDEWFLLNGVLNINDLIPQLGFLDLQGYEKRMKILAKKFDRLLELVLDEHSQRKRREGVDFVAKDMIDVMLQLVEDPDSDLDVKLERDGIKGFSVDLITGGTETSAVIAEWAMCELLRQPEMFKKATTELDIIIGKNRWVQECDITNLPFIDAIMKETMRLHPPGALLHHIFTEDIKIAGYDIPKGTIGMVSGWSIGRDPKLWVNPEEFCPERFIGKDIDVKGQHYELLPFGSGRRMCPGYTLGLKVIQTSIANILHGFTWELANGMRKEDLDMEELEGLSNPKKIRLLVVAKPRLDPHLY